MKNTLLSIGLALLHLSPLCRGEAPLLDFLPVHRQSDALIDSLPLDAKGVPILPASAEWSDHLIVPFTQRDEMTGQVRHDAEGKPVIDYLIVTKPEVLRERGLYISSQDIDDAQRERHLGATVSLTEQGGERMQLLTADMCKGVDRLALRVRGGVVSALVVNDSLSRHFLIAGLSPIEMAQLLNRSGEAVSLRDACLAELRARDLPPLSPMSDEDYTLIEQACEASKPHGITELQLPQSSSMTALIELLEAQPDTLTDEQLALRLDLVHRLATNETLLYHKGKNILASSPCLTDPFAVEVDGVYIRMHELPLIRERDGHLVIERYKVKAGASLPHAWQLWKRQGIVPLVFPL